MKRIFFILLFVILSHNANSAILKEESFNNLANWTVTQPSDATVSCYPGNCSFSTPGGIWEAIYNGACHCDNSLTGEPGNNLLYINQYAGYPRDSEQPYGGTGKCLTFWQESCLSYFDNSDGDFGTYLSSEKQEIYVRMFVKFQANFERQPLDGSQGGFAMKMFHFQHNEVPNQPFTYGSNDTNNWNKPAVIGGINQYSTNINFYAAVRCVSNYLYCSGGEQIVYWPIGTVPGVYTNGIFDNQWHCIELRAKLNSGLGIHDGIVEMWLDGVKKNYLSGYEGDNLEWNDSATYGLRGLNFIAFGGNSFNQWENVSTNMSDREQWYAFDEIVISDSYIGPSYVIGTPPSSIVTCTIDTTNNQTVSNPSFIISGTASTTNGTITSVTSTGLTISGTTSWSTTATLSSGLNTFNITATDSNNNSDTKTINVTYNPPAQASNALLNGNFMGILFQ